MATKDDINKLNDEFIEDIDADKEAARGVEEDDSDSEEESSGGSESDEEEQEEKTEEKEVDDTDDEEEALPDVLLTRDERQAKESKAPVEDEDDLKYLSPEDRKVHDELLSLEDDEKFGATAKGLRERFKSNIESEVSVSRMLSELGSDIRQLGLTPEDLNDPKWTVKLKAAIRAELYSELSAQGLISGKASPKKETTKETQATSLDDIDDDEIISGKDFKRLMKSSLAKVEAPLAEMERGKVNSRNEQLFTQLYDAYWDADPLLKQLSQDPKEGKRLKAMALKSFGSNHASFLGRDGSGLPIKKNLEDFADLLRVGLRSSRSLSKDEPEAEKSTTSKKRGPLSKRGSGVQAHTDIPSPKMTSKVGGVVRKKSIQEGLDELNESFSKSLGFGG